MPLPSRTITVLSIGCAVLAAAYVALVAATIFFATIRTDLMVSIRSMESTVASLETEYYDAIARLSATDVAAAGFVNPVTVDYIAAAGAPAVTRADR